MKSAAIYLAAIAIILPGCSKAPVDETPKSYENLRTIGNAYATATVKNNRPPEKKEDLKPFLKDLPEENFRSPEDGEEYVILWNVDYRKFDYQPVVAYEKIGRGGKRWVLQNRDVVFLGDADFRKAKFPLGHKPPP